MLSSLSLLSAILWNLVGISALLVGVAATVSLINAPMFSDLRFSTRGLLFLITLAAALMCLMAFSVNVALPLVFQLLAFSVANGVLVVRTRGNHTGQPL